MKTRLRILLLVFSMLASAPPPLAAHDKLRVIIETDAGGDPDDEQSLVRFLLYANEWDIEGIIANRTVARPGENLNPVRTGLGIVRQHLSAYGQVHDRLKENSPGYPGQQQLWDRTVSGCADSDAGVDLIIAAVDRDDRRLVWFQNWGTDHGSDPSNLKRALDRILAERGSEGYAKFKNKILLSSDDQFGDHTAMIPPGWRHWVQPSRPKLEGANWYHRFGPLTATAGGFDLHRDVLTGHGPLGALYPTNTNIRQKEGDSAYFLYLLPTGMNDPMQPGWGSWGGRHGVRDDAQAPNPNYFWANLRDAWQGSTNRDNTLKRWAADIQNDFRARMDWCVKPFGEANHHPVAVLAGDTSREILTLAASPGSSLKLDASASYDPDHQKFTCHWLIYPEAGTYRGEVRIIDEDQNEARVMVPADAAGKDIHVILIVRDSGSPALAAYRRAVIRVSKRSAARAGYEGRAGGP